MPSQIITLLGIASPGYTAPPLRNITVNLTRDGQPAAEYKELILWDSIRGRIELLAIPIRDGISTTRTLVAAAVDGKKALLVYDFDIQPYGAVRTVNITQDMVLNIDLNDGTESGGGGVPTDPASVSAVVRVDKLPVEREVVAIEKTSTGEWRMAGNSIIQAGELAMQVTGGQIFAVALDDFGRAFQSDLTLEIGQSIRPTNFQGWLYRCTEAGQLPQDEPEWWLEQGENPPRLVGTARLQAIRYYQPIAHGPIHYELI